jgi:ABC-2 type transport system permease protein/lipopolysaccharide transport system permease protein
MEATTIAANGPSTSPMTTLHIASSGERASKALRDVADGIAMWELWSVLGWNDIRQRYRRSLLGPFWLTLSMGVMIGTIGFVYGRLFQQSTPDYLPYLTLGFIVWGLVSGIVLDACAVFTGSEGIIRQVRVPYSVHIFRMLWRNIIVFAHNIVIYLVVMVLFAIRPNAALFFIIPGFLLICLNGLWVGMLLGALSARFRDLQPIVFNIMQIFFYVTPIVWKPEQLAEHPAIVQLNPLFHFIELLRLPLLGIAPPAATWFVILGITAAGFLVTLAFLTRLRGRIAYWL